MPVAGPSEFAEESANFTAAEKDCGHGVDPVGQGRIATQTQCAERLGIVIYIDFVDLDLREFHQHLFQRQTCRFAATSGAGVEIGDNRHGHTLSHAAGEGNLMTDAIPAEEGVP